MLCWPKTRNNSVVADLATLRPVGLGRRSSATLLLGVGPQKRKTRKNDWKNERPFGRSCSVFKVVVFCTPFAYYFYVCFYQHWSADESDSCLTHEAAALDEKGISTVRAPGIPRTESRMMMMMMMTTTMTTTMMMMMLMMMLMLMMMMMMLMLMMMMMMMMLV